MYDYLKQRIYWSVSTVLTWCSAIDQIWSSVCFIHEAPGPWSYFKSELLSLIKITKSSKRILIVCGQTCRNVFIASLIQNILHRPFESIEPCCFSFARCNTCVLNSQNMNLFVQSIVKRAVCHSRSVWLDFIFPRCLLLSVGHSAACPVTSLPLASPYSRSYEDILETLFRKYLLKFTNIIFNINLLEL